LSSNLAIRAPDTADCGRTAKQASVMKTINPSATSAILSVDQNRAM